MHLESLSSHNEFLHLPVFSCSCKQTLEGSFLQSLQTTAEDLNYEDEPLKSQTLFLLQQHLL